MERAGKLSPSRLLGQSQLRSEPPQLKCTLFQFVMTSEPTVHRGTNESARLFLTPRKVEASTELRPGVAVSKEIGNCASAKIAENAHWPPQPHRLEAAAIAECEERV